MAEGASVQQATGRVRVTFTQAMALLGPYIKDRLMEQVKSVWLIITYLILFQTLVLGISISNASAIAIGLALVVLGLTFFWKDLCLGSCHWGRLSA